MFLSELDVINDMLATLGESPLNELDEQHPLVSSGLRQLRVASYREQAKSWWFNRERVTLQPDTLGNIMVPNDAIRVDPVNQYVNIVQRGRKLYNPYTASYTFTDAITCVILRHIPFDDLPPSAQVLVGAAAVMDFQSAFDADEQKYAKLSTAYRNAYATLNAEHIRNQNANRLQSESFMEALNNVSPRSRASRLPVGGTY